MDQQEYADKRSGSVREFRQIRNDGGPPGLPMPYRCHCRWTRTLVRNLVAAILVDNVTTDRWYTSYTTRMLQF
jgi:hypothetical protein